MIIGYQGEIESNADAAAHRMCEALGFGEVEYRPLIGSRNVVCALRSGQIDYGVVAVRNSITGSVEETLAVVHGEDLELVATHLEDIHHSLYCKPDAKIDSLTQVASHIQALKQTRVTRAAKWPELQEVEVADTARAARLLAEGELADDVAVICRYAAGLHYGLKLLARDIEDTQDNRTEFRLFKLVGTVKKAN